MTRKEQIELLLTASEEKLEIIFSIFKKSIEEQRLDNKVLIEIKGYLENLRSVLDYLAKEVFYKYCNATNKRKIYFPITKSNSPDDFIDHLINTNFPTLKEKNVDLYNFLVRIQPQQHQDSMWLENLSNLCNQNKHDSLSLHERRDDVMVRLAYKNWKTFYWNDGLVRFPKDGQIALEPGGQFYENRLPDNLTDSPLISSFGWIVQKLNNYKIRTCPDLSSIDKSIYSLDSFLVGNFYFSDRPMAASMDLQWLLPKVWKIKDELYSIL